jgi:hypothetical protein
LFCFFTSLYLIFLFFFSFLEIPPELLGALEFSSSSSSTVSPEVTFGSISPNNNNTTATATTVNETPDFSFGGSPSQSDSSSSNTGLDISFGGETLSGQGFAVDSSSTALSVSFGQDFISSGSSLTEMKEAVDLSFSPYLPPSSSSFASACLHSFRLHLLFFFPVWAGDLELLYSSLRGTQQERDRFLQSRDVLGKLSSLFRSLCFLEPGRIHSLVR